MIPQIIWGAANVGRGLSLLHKGWKIAAPYVGRHGKALVKDIARKGSAYIKTAKKAWKDPNYSLFRKGDKSTLYYNKPKPILGRHAKTGVTSGKRKMSKPQYSLEENVTMPPYRTGASGGTSKGSLMQQVKKEGNLKGSLAQQKLAKASVKPQYTAETLNLHRSRKMAMVEQRRREIAAGGGRWPKESKTVGKVGLLGYVAHATYTADYGEDEKPKSNTDKANVADTKPGIDVKKKLESNTSADTPGTVVAPEALKCIFTVAPVKSVAVLVSSSVKVNLSCGPVSP